MTKIIMTVLSLLLFASPLYAAGVDDLQVRELEKFANARQVDYNDSHAININYVGSSTEACIGISSWTVACDTPYGTKDTSFGTAGTYDISATAHDTLTELCNAIEILADYECTITEGKRNDNSKYLKDVTAASGSYDANAAGGYNVLFDSGTYAATIAQHLRIGIIPKDGRQIVLKRCMANGEGTRNLEVSGKSKRYEGVSDGVTRNDTTIVWTSAASTDDTDEYYPVDSATAPIGEWIEFGRNEHVVISYNAAAALTATNVMWCEWMEK